MGPTEIVALLGVIGTLVGTLGGATLNHILTKWKEEEAYRRETRQQVYEDFATLFLMPDETLDLDKEAERYARVFTRMDLFGSPKVRTVARQIFNLDLERISKKEGATEYDEIVARLEQARSTFLDAVREELGYPHD